MELLNHFLLYLAIIWSVLATYKKWPIIFPSACISCVLLQFNMPDISSYRDYYELTNSLGLSIYSYNNYFEVGFVSLVLFFSKLFNFDFFYIIIITLVVYTSLKFFITLNSANSYIYVSFFLTLCLYFLAFTLRTSIASILLLIALLYIYKDENLIASFCIILGSLFHIVILFSLVFIFVRKIQSLSPIYLYFFAFTGFISILLFDYQFLSYFEFFNFKIKAYSDIQGFELTNFFILWFGIIFFSLFKIKNYSKFDKSIVFGMLIIIIIFMNNSFFLGRIFWISSAVFIYCLVNLFIKYFIPPKNISFFIIFIFPMLVFFRNFNVIN